MNNGSKLPVIHHTSYLPVFVDISKDSLAVCIGRSRSTTPVAGQRIAYRVDCLQQWIEELMEDYQLSSGRPIQFVCEPTGGLQHKLVLVARQYGASVRYVESERMYNARMLTYGNGEKTDEKDPGAIGSLYVLGHHRPGEPREMLHQTVRSISQQYEELSRQAVRARNKIHGLLGYVFVDYAKSPGWTFSRSGQALAREFGFCPQYILQAGQEEFARRLKAHVPRIRWSTLAQLWQMAERSVAIAQGEGPDPRQEFMMSLYEQWLWLEARKDELVQRLTTYGERWRQQGWLPTHLPPKVSAWMLVRVIAETGPLERFSHIRQLWAYLGLKLACRQSGKYTGHIKITKKGSALARKLLFQICLSLAGPDGWLHAAYKRQNPQGRSGGQGIRAMTAVMRKFVQVILAMQHSGEAFQPARLMQCESQYRPERTPQEVG